MKNICCNADGLRCTYWDMEAWACVSSSILCVGVFLLWKDILLPGPFFELKNYASHCAEVAWNEGREESQE